MAKVYDVQGNVKGEAKLPPVFSTEYRPEVIKRAVLSVQSEKRQAYGSDELAGKRTSAHYHGRRRKRSTMMGRGISRMARIHGKVGYLAFRARFVPQAVKGRRAHPPLAEKVWEKRINRKEMAFSIRSALAACASHDIVEKRGHIFENDVPIVLEDKFESIDKSKKFFEILNKIGLGKELDRAKEKKVRAGKGTERNRKYRKKKGPLLIVSSECSLQKAARNIPGFDVSQAHDIEIEMLAPGTHAGRLLLVTEPALKELEKIK